MENIFPNLTNVLGLARRKPGYWCDYMANNSGKSVPISKINGGKRKKSIGNLLRTGDEKENEWFRGSMNVTCQGSYFTLSKLDCTPTENRNRAMKFSDSYNDITDISIIGKMLQVSIIKLSCCLWTWSTFWKPLVWDEKCLGSVTKATGKLAFPHLPTLILF